MNPKKQKTPGLLQSTGSMLTGYARTRPSSSGAYHLAVPRPTFLLRLKLLPK